MFTCISNYPQIRLYSHSQKYIAEFRKYATTLRVQHKLYYIIFPQY